MDQLINVLKNDGIAVIPTDTIYGIVGFALNPKAVEKIYKLRKRSKEKPFIILISSINDLQKFSVKLTKEQKDFLKKHWPNPLSVVLPVVSEEFKYLHRGKNSLAFRMPKDENLLALLEQTGPLVAPSANLEGEKPAENIEDAKKYFDSEVDFYLDGGTLMGKSSTLIEFKNNSINILRQGNYLASF